MDLISHLQQYPESQKPQTEDEHQQQQPRWKDERDRERERDRKLKEERPRPKDSHIGPKEDGKEGSDLRITSEDHRAMSKDSRSNPHMQFSSPLAQHQGYMPYMHGYPYGQGYDPNHPGYRGMPSVMMQNYPGKHALLFEKTMALRILFVALKNVKKVQLEFTPNMQLVWNAAVVSIRLQQGSTVSEMSTTKQSRQVWTSCFTIYLQTLQIQLNVTTELSKFAKMYLQINWQFSEQKQLLLAWCHSDSVDGSLSRISLFFLFRIVNIFCISNNFEAILCYFAWRSEIVKAAWNDYMAEPIAGQNTAWE